jgi:hypothetical protein
MGFSNCVSIAGHPYDRETVDLLRGVLDAGWALMNDAQRVDYPRSLIARRLLQEASAGERNPAVLRSRAFRSILSGISG